MGVADVVILSVLVVVVPLVVSPVHFSLYVIHKALVLGLLATLFLVVIFLRTWRESGTRLIFPLALPLLLYLGSAFLSLSQAVNPYEGGARLLLIVTGIALFWAIANSAPTLDAGARLLALAGLTGLLVSLVGIYQVWRGEIPGLEEVLPPASTFGNKALAAQFVVLVLPLPFLFVVFHRDWWKELFWGVGGGLVLTYLIYTRSRGAWVAALAAWLVVFLALRARGDLALLFGLTRRKVWMLVGVAVLVTTMTAAAEYLPTERRIEPVQKELFSLVQPREYVTGSIRFRPAWWANTLAMIRDHPILGVGLGNWPLLYPRYARSVIVDPGFFVGTEPNETHNDYLQILAETGPAGLLAFFWILLGFGRRAWQGFFTTQDRFRRLAILALSVGLLSLLGHALVDFPFQQPVPTAFFWIFSGLLWTLSSLIAAGPREWRRLGLILWGGLIVLVASYAALNLARVRADYHFARVAGYEWPSKQERLQSPMTISAGLGEVKAAIARYPFEYNYHLGEGILHLRLGAYREAAQATLRAVRLHPYYLSAYINLGLAYMGADDAEKAEAAFARALKIWPDSLEAHNNLGILYASVGRRAEAKREFLTALRLQPEDTRARHNLQLLLTEEAGK